MSSPAAVDQPMTFRANECMFKEGATSDAAYLILAGRVELRRGAFSSAPVTVATLGKGEVVGELSLFDNGPHMASAIALEPTQVRAVTRDTFKRQLAVLDPAMAGIMRTLVKRVLRAGGKAPTAGSEVNWNHWKKT